MGIFSQAFFPVQPLSCPCPAIPRFRTVSLPDRRDPPLHLASHAPCIGLQKKAEAQVLERFPFDAFLVSCYIPKAVEGGSSSPPQQNCPTSWRAA